jgi:Lipase (class 3)
VGDRIVISFRGSILANLLTDLKLSQVTIPSLKFRKRFFIKMIKEIEREKHESECEDRMTDANTRDKRDEEKDSDKEKEKACRIGEGVGEKVEEIRLHAHIDINESLGRAHKPGPLGVNTDDIIPAFSGKRTEHYILASQSTLSPLPLPLAPYSSEAPTDVNLALLTHHTPHTPSDSSILSISPLNDIWAQNESLSQPNYPNNNPNPHLGSDSTVRRSVDITANTTSPSTFYPFSPLSTSTTDLQTNLPLTKRTSPKISARDPGSTDSTKEELSPLDSFNKKREKEIELIDPTVSILQPFAEDKKRGGNKKYFLGDCLSVGVCSVDSGGRRFDSETASYYLENDGTGADLELDSSRGSSYTDLEAHVLKSMALESESRGTVGRRGREERIGDDVYWEDTDGERERYDERGRSSKKEREREWEESRDLEKRGVESSWYSCLRNVLSRLPIFQHTLPRIHEGFWGAYSSVRTGVLLSIVRAFCDHRKQHRQICSLLDLYDGNLDGRWTGVGLGLGTWVGEKPVLSPLQQRSVRRQLSKPLRVYFSGHSLGAALTVLAALDLSVNLNYILDAIESVYGDGAVRTTREYSKYPYSASKSNPPNFSNDSTCRTYERVATGTYGSSRRFNSQESHSHSAPIQLGLGPNSRSYAAEGRVCGIGGIDGISGRKNAEMKEMKEVTHPKWATPTIAVYTYGGECCTSCRRPSMISLIWFLSLLSAMLLLLLNCWLNSLPSSTFISIHFYLSYSLPLYLSLS